MSYESIATTLERGETVIIDGGTGTELERRGASMNPEAWCGAATLDNEALLEEIHRDYIAAGAKIITANTYASSRIMLESAGLSDHFDALNRTAVQVAHRARAESGATDVAVAGSLSHMVPLIPGSGYNDHSRIPPAARQLEAFTELAMLHADEGCDMILLEMMFHPDRMPHALDAAEASGLPYWVGLAARETADGELVSFTDEADIPLAELMTIVADYSPSACGIMHTPSNSVSAGLDIIGQHFDGPLTAYPDSGYFAMPEWRFENIIEPSELHDFAVEWKSKGAQVLGGCCGLSPAHIEALAPLG